MNVHFESLATPLLLQGCKEIFNVTYGNDILIPFGSDFQWVSAQQYYKNVDKLIHYLNLDGRVNAFYSSPAGVQLDFSACW